MKERIHSRDIEYRITEDVVTVKVESVNHENCQDDTAPLSRK